MDSNKKIDLINAYRQLVGTQLKLGKSTPEDISGIVQSEFKAFVDSRIDELLNGKMSNTTPTSTDVFSAEEIEILKALIDGVRSRQNGVPQQRRQVKQRQPAQYDQPETELRGSSNARPLVDPDPDGLKLRSAQAAILQQLQKMEDSGPEF